MKPNCNLNGEIMGANFTLKNIPQDLFDKIKARAERNHRSINGEIIASIEAATASRHVPVDEILARARVLRERTRGLLTDDLIDHAKRDGRP
jgi:plasmid stability protein